MQLGGSGQLSVPHVQLAGCWSAAGDTAASAGCVQLSGGQPSVPQVQPGSTCGGDTQLLGGQPSSPQLQLNVSAKQQV